MNLERKVYETRAQKVGDFFLGVGLMIGLNIVLSIILGFAGGLITSITDTVANDTLTSIISILLIVIYSLPCLIQIVLLIYFGLTRYWIALGMLGTIALALLLTLLLVGACFVLVFAGSGGLGQ